MSVADKLKKITVQDSDYAIRQERRRQYTEEARQEAIEESRRQEQAAANTQHAQHSRETYLAGMQQRAAEMSDEELDAEINRLQAGRPQGSEKSSGINRFFGSLLTGTGNNKGAADLYGKAQRDEENEIKLGAYRSTLSPLLKEQDRRQSAERQSAYKTMTAQQLRSAYENSTDGTERSEIYTAMGDKLLDRLSPRQKKILDDYRNADYAVKSANAGGFAGAFTGGVNYNYKAQSELQKAKQAVIAEFGESWADLYTDIYDRKLNASEAEERNTRAAQLADRHPVIGTAASAATSFYKPAALAEAAEAFLERRPIDYNSPYFAAQGFSGAVTDTVKNKVDWSVKLPGYGETDMFDFLYDTGMSMVDSIASGTIMGPFGGAFIGLEAAADTMYDAAQKGLDVKDSVVQGVLAGIFEGLFETVSLSQFKGLQEQGIKNLFSREGVKQFFRNIGVSTLTNASEETFTEIANVLADVAINGGVSGYGEAAEEYMLNGYTEKEARKKAAGDMALQVIAAGAGGALMGGVMGGMGSALGANAYRTQQRYADRVRGAQLVSNGKAETVAQRADSSRLKEKVLAEATARREAAAQAKSAADVAQAAGAAVQADEAKNRNKPKMRDSRFLEGVGELDAQIKNKEVELATVKRLQQLGEAGDEKQLTKTARAIINTVEGAAYNADEKTIRNSRYGNKVLNELKTAAQGKTYLDNGWAYRMADRLGAMYDIPSQSLRDSSSQGEPGTSTAGAAQGDNPSQSLRDSSPQGEPEADTTDKYVVKTTEKEYTAAEIEKLPQAQRETVLAAGKYNPEGASVFIENKPNNISVPVYNSSFSSLYTAGRLEATSYDEAAKKNHYSVELLGEDVARAAFNAGRNEVRAAQRTAAPAGGVRTEGRYENATEKKSRIDAVYSAIAAKTGLDIQRVEELTDGQRTANGEYIVGAARIIMSEGARNETGDVVHELGHFAADFAGEKYRAAAGAIVGYNMSRYGQEHIDNEIRGVMKDYGVGYAAAKEEYINECFAGLFSTDDGMQQFIEWLNGDSGYSEKEKKGILQKLREMLDKVIDILKEVLHRENMSSIAKEQAETELEKAKEMRALLLEALDEAGAKVKGTGEAKAETGEKKGSFFGQDVVNTDAEKAAEFATELRKQKVYLMNARERFEAELNFYRKYQQGKANKDTFFTNTIAEFVKVKYRPRRKPDFVSKSRYDGKVSSEYWYTADGVIRGSNHWGNEIRSCDWALEGENLLEYRVTKTSKLYGFCKWEDFVYKTYVEGAKKGADGRYSDFSEASLTSFKTEEEKLKKEKKSFFGQDAEKADADYMAAVERGDMETAQRMVNERLFSITAEKIDGIIKHIETASDAELDNAVTLLGVLNGMANKGYRRLNERQKAENQKIYALKEKYVYELAKKYKEAGREVSYFAGAVYFRRKDGIQISFHTGRAFNKFEDRIVSLLGIRKTKWDGVENAYAYNASDLQKYEKIKSEKEAMAKAADNYWEELSRSEYETLYNYLSKYKRAEKYGIDLSKDLEMNGTHVFLKASFSDKEYIYERVFGKTVEKYRDEQFNKIKEYISAKNSNYYWEDGKIRETNPKVYKSLNPVTYDDNGKVIPLSQRFNEKSADIRYSLQPVEDENELLKKENRRLEEINRALRYEYGYAEQGVPDGKKVSEAASRIKKDVNSSLSPAEIGERLKDIYSRMNSGDWGFESFQAACRSLADELIETSNNWHEPTEESKAMLKEIRSSPIKLSETQKAEAAYSAGGKYGDFYRSVFGKMSIRNDGTPLDIQWQAWAAQYPEWFDYDTKEPDQPIALKGIIQSLSENYDSEWGMYAEEEAEILTTEIMNEFYKLPNLATRSEQNFQKIEELRRQYREEHRKALDELKAQRIKYESEYHRKVNEAELEAAAKYRAREVQNRADRQLTLDKAETRAAIVRKVKSLDKLLRAETDDRHVPEELKGTAATLLTFFTKNTSVFDKYMMDDVQKAYEALTKDNEDADYAELYDDDIAQNFRELEKMLGDGKRLSELGLRDLEKIRDIVDHIRFIIDSGNEVFYEGKRRKTADLGKKLFGEMDGKQKKYFTVNGKQVDMTALLTDSLTPVYYFERLSDTWKGMYKEIRAGQDKYTGIMENAKEFITSEFRKYNTEKWLDSTERRTVETVRGDKIPLTTQEAMLIYATAKRERLAGKDAKHLLDGGVVLADNLIKKTDKKNRLIEYTSKDSTKYRLTPIDINAIGALLTDEQKQFTDELVGYLSTDMAEYGNETSMQLYGIKKYTEPYYIPYNSDKNYSKIRLGVSDDKKLKNMSMTKRTVSKASTPLIVSDFMSVWANHVEDMAMYSSFAVPIDGIERLYNYKENPNSFTFLRNEARDRLIAKGFDENTAKDISSVVAKNVKISQGEDEHLTETETETEYKYESEINSLAQELMKVSESGQRSIADAFNRAYGRHAQNYLNTFMKDVNGAVIKDSRDKSADKLLGNFKKAAVMANLSVIVQQPSAVARAFAVLSPKYFVTSTLKGRGSATWEECKKYAKAATIKEIGRFDTGIGHSGASWLTDELYDTARAKLGAAKDKNFKPVFDSIDEAMGFGAELADKITWCHIWQACKQEARSKYGLSGEALLKKAGERFSEVVDKTQVYDSTLTRSHMMRSQSMYMKIVTAFMAEPTVSLNMIMDAGQKVKQKGNRGYSAAAVTSVLLQIVFNTALRSFIKAARDDGEESYWEKYLGNLFADFYGSKIKVKIKDKEHYIWDAGITGEFSVGSWIPFVKDLISIFSGYDVERSDMSNASAFIQSVQKLLTANFGGEDEDPKAQQKTVMNVITSAAALFGLPAKSIYRDMTGIVNVIKNRDLSFTWQGVKNKFNELTGGETMTKADKVYFSLVNGDRESFERFKAGYKDEASLDSAISGRVKEEYIAGTITEDEAIKQLVDFCGKDNDTAYWTVQEWTAKAGGAEEYSKYDELDKLLQNGSNEAISAEVQRIASHGSTEDKVLTEVSKHIRQLYEDKVIDSERALKLLTDVKGFSNDDARRRVAYWDFQGEYDYDWSEEQVEKYYDMIAPSGIEVDDFNEYLIKAADCKGTDLDGDGKTDSGSKKAEILIVIDDLPISYEQKNLLYDFNGWSDKTRYEAPWY